MGSRARPTLAVERRALLQEEEGVDEPDDGLPDLGAGAAALLDFSEDPDDPVDPEDPEEPADPEDPEDPEDLDEPDLPEPRESVR